MSKPVAIWNHRDRAHVMHFAELIKPIARAAGTAGTRILDDAAVAAETVQSWIYSLADVPADVLEEARERLMRAGVTWMPQPGHLRQHCRDVVADRRKAISANVQALLASCTCYAGPDVEAAESERGWELVTDDRGVQRLRRCLCWRRGQALLAEQPQAIALIEGEREDGAA